MSQSDKKRKIELRHFALFRECYKEFPSDGQPDEENRDSPDFLIKHSKGILGIEHTQLFKKAKKSCKERFPQTLESYKKCIIDYAQKCCQKDHPNLYVRVWFNFNLTVPKNRKHRI